MRESVIDANFGLALTVHLTDALETAEGLKARKFVIFAETTASTRRRGASRCDCALDP
jgi:hypothetical protein